MTENKIGGAESNFSTRDILIRIDKALWGNGNPGALERITRIEETVENLLKQTEENSKSIKDLTTSISELKDIVKSHVEDPSKHRFLSLIFTKQNVAYILIGFIGLHEIAEFAPTVFNFILKLVGL